MFRVDRFELAGCAEVRTFNNKLDKKLKNGYFDVKLEKICDNED